jgi:16S rRNA C967 or C1407 C5-methylase (RsmB/RsmF family)/NOL1/NOP2/fmu family ribosome biogenesis protein
MAHHFPEQFWLSLPAAWQAKQADIEQAHTLPAAISIRKNPLKPSTVFPEATSVPWALEGRYLNQRPFFAADPLWHAGAYYVQEPSSMFLEQALRQSLDLSVPHRVLDLCAAPGGKSTHAASLLSADSLLVSNEVIQSRVGVLAANMSTWGYNNTWVTNNDPQAFGAVGAYFDVLLVDAPCSGSGLFRKMPDYLNEWTPDFVTQCAARQERIVRDAYDALCEGGILIYMTCSMSVAENEAMLDTLMAEHALRSVPLSIDPNWGVEETQSERGAYGYRLAPHLLAGEGFYLAVFQKLDGEPLKEPLPVKAKKPTLLIPDGFYATDNAYLFLQGDMVLAIQENHRAILEALSGRLKWIKKGVALGKLIHGDLIPDHELALAVAGSYPQRWNLTLADAQRYLQKEAIEHMPAKKGWYLMQYENTPIGWAKHLGNRMNNYYPTERRILHKSILE